MKTSIRIKGMHCASCAAIIEKTLRKEPGVGSVDVNYGSESATLSFDEKATTLETLSERIKPLGYTLTNDEAKSADPTSEKRDELRAMKRIILSLIPAALISIFIMGWDTLAQLGLSAEMPAVADTFFHHLLPVLATYTVVVAGKPYVLGLWRFLRYGKANMDTLIGIGTGAAFIYSFAIGAFEDALRPFLNVEHSYFDVTIVVITFITLGKYLETRAKRKTGDAVEKLLRLQAKTALVVRDGAEKNIPLEEVVHGDVIIIKPGMSLPVDGCVIDGASYVDESMISGEAMPVEKTDGSTVIAGTLNTSGSFNYTATGIGNETMLARIIALVEQAQNSKAPIQALADRISGVFVPIVIAIAALSLVSWLVFGIPALGFAQALSYGLSSFVSVLVIACPCALGLATPTAVIVGIGKGAREGILVKDAASLEKLHGVTTMVVDKTGTITQGKPTVVSVKAQPGTNEKDLMTLLASIEARSEHPLAQAISAYAAQQGLTLSTIENFRGIQGKGLRATINGVEYVAGSPAFMKELGLSIDSALIEEESAKGRTPIMLAGNKKLLGLVLVADALKPEAAEAVRALHALNIKVIMLSGDNARTAGYVAAQTGIDEVVAEVLPQDKLMKIKELQAAGETVAMAGDGVNDAPALAQADVGIAMATGTDVAIDSAGIILLHGDISKLVKAVRLSKRSMAGIKQNLFWAFFYNIVGIPLAAGLFFPIFGWLLNPVFAGLAMALSSVSVVLNSLRLKSAKL